KLIAWWDQERVGKIRILVVGAGALGNEILKLLALIGCGATLVYDPDRIERSNLSRSVLFRTSDEGGHKAEVCVRQMQDLNPDARGHARCENLIAGAGLGAFLWADVVIGAVDNREARVFINSACARTRRTWVDGAIERLSGIVRVFSPHDGACYECTMNATDRKLLAERRSSPAEPQGRDHDEERKPRKVAREAASREPERAPLDDGNPPVTLGTFVVVGILVLAVGGMLGYWRGSGSAPPMLRSARCSIARRPSSVPAPRSICRATWSCRGAARRAAPPRPGAPCSAPCASRRRRVRAAAPTARSRSRRRSAATAWSISR
ncbi:MAG: hypothetical protein E6J90_06630, partial [Deltaproteobacteria bacterium]